MLNPLEMQGYIQAIAARADMAVVWEQDVTAPRTDGRTIWLPHITAAMTPEKYAELKHYVVHEVDHVRFTDFKVSSNEPTCKDGIYGAVLNMVEDIRVETKGAAEYLGDRMNSGNVQSQRIAQIGDEMEGNLRKTGPEAQWLKQGYPLLNWSHKHWSDLYPAVAGSASVFERGCQTHPDAKKYADRFAKNAAEYDAAVRALKNTGDAIKLAEKIAREVYEVDPDEERKKAKAKREAEGKGKGKEGKEGKEKKEGEGDGKLGKGGDKKREEEATVDFSKIMVDPHESMGPSRAALHIRYKKRDFEDGTYTPCKKEDYKVHKRGAVSSRWARDGSEILSGMINILRKTNPNFAHKVRTILQVRAKDRMQYGMKRGHLNQGALHRLSVDNPHYAERVFKKKIVNDVLDSCVFLLVDQSGSMGGHGNSKFAHAAVAAAMMSEVIGNVLHIPTYVASFTDFDSCPSGNGELMNIYVHREWSDKLLPNDRLLQSFATASTAGMGNNADGDAIMWAYDQIIRQRQKRKLIIVFSDGSPAGGGRGDEAWYTKHVVEGIEKQSPVDIVGIGIQDRNVKYIYKEHHVIDNLNKLEEALLDTIEGKLK